MATNYEMWSPRRLPHNERALVATIYHAWAAGRPLTRGAAFAGLLKQGATAAAAASVLEAIAGPPRRSGGARESSVGEGATGRYAVVRDLNLSLVPRVIAALALVDDDLVRRDLDELGRLVSYLNQSYVGRLRGLSTSDVARTLDLDRSYVDRLVELGEFKRRDGGIEVGDEVLDWTTYDEFLRSRVPFATIKSAPKEPVVPSAVLQVRWQGLGPFRTATTLDLDPMTVLVGANGAGKTTSLMALSLLKAIAAGGLSSLRAFVPRVSEGTDEMMIATVVELQRSKTVSTETIDWQLVAGVAGRVRASSERLRRIRPIDHETELSAFEFGQGRWIAHDGAFVEHTMQVDELALTTSGSPGQLASLRQIMLGCRIPNCWQSGQR